MPLFNPETIALLVLAVLAAAWAGGVFRPDYADGRLSLRVWRGRRLLVTFDFRDSWLLLGIVLLMGWSVAATVERSAWVPGSDGKLVPALALAGVLGWLFASSGVSRLGYLLLSLPSIVVGVLLFAATPLTSGAGALPHWLLTLPNQTNALLMICLVLMSLVAGLWTSWWVFRRRNGLVALLPTGTILAVEIINDTSLSLTFFTLVWLATAAGLLLRLNFVALKDGWRKRRLPHAADTGWTFGEVGVEATVAILVVAFLLVPPLSSTDISAALIPGSVRTDNFHPFGIGSGGSGRGGIGSIGYSETVRPGSQLKAKSQTVMVVSGDTPNLYPYWRGIALAGWDGIQWYELGSTTDVPVRQQPRLTPGTSVPRDDLPSDSQRLLVLQNSFRILVPIDQTKGAVFSAGELLSVHNQPTTVRGIMTALPAPEPGPAPALVNVPGDQTEIARFDSIDSVRLARQLQPPYSYSVTEAIPNVDVADLQSAGTRYPSWLAPYVTLYYGGRVAPGYSVARDAEIADLARQIVNAAGAKTPYDQAKAIEAWFIAKNRFTYTLTPPPAPAGVRPLDYFLFTSRKGFCQDFSTAMNVMLRTLGIPSRQMSGFGVGTFDEKTHQYTVNALDAHSWVEVYFPGYGWIPFEPTPDGLNAPINRPLTRDQLNLPLPALTAPTARPRDRQIDPNADSGGSSGGAGFADVWRPLLVVGGVLLLLLIISLLFAVRWLMSVKDVTRIWRRLLFLGNRLKVRRSAGDTPQEFGGRLADAVPDLDDELRRLAELYTRARFRRGGLRPDELAAARVAWTRVRRSYAGLVARAWRDALRNGRVVSEAEAAASRNRGPSRRR
ncbi:MAG TPA: transglutaminaseTgpA domain-containing protein [Candidatus Dormibacteraeota bacterium]|nr:transglutaminaseTgpA domain-containing protein [Candidatus Dormibacteraeota bacterium]